MDELPKPGDVVGVRYRIEATLGQGGMGAVFSAVNQATGRAVAIKWMLPGAARSQESLARFLSEARATAKIEHPNVIQILDVGQDGACPFLVMERLRGQSLADRLHRGGRLTPEETLSVIIPSCRGVAEAHTEGIIHRDLKPDNIFLCEGKDGSPRPPKVLDFGISKLYDESGGPAITRTGIAMGTPQYMSPEQLNAPPDADGRFDVYAMGVVLYECLTGKPPYDAEGLFELVQQIAAGNPAPIRFVAPLVPPDLEAVVMRAMHANRDVRHPTMQDLIGDLERVWQRMQAGAPPPHVPLPSVPHTAAMPSPAGVPTGPMGGSSQWGQQSSYGAPGTPQYGYPPTGMHGPAPTSGYAPPTGGYAPGMTGAVAPQGASKGAGMIVAVVAGAVVLLGLLVVGVGGAAFFLSRSDDSDAPTPVANTGGGGGGGTTTPGEDPPVGNTPNSSRVPIVGVTFTGDCNARFNARLMVTGGSDSVNVMSSSLGGLTGSIMMSMHDVTGTTNISTQQRMDTQTAINVMVGQRLWTNMALDSTAVTLRRIQDPISGSITVTEFDSDLARADVTFHSVTLQNMQDGSICTLNGRLQTFGTTYGM